MPPTTALAEEKEKVHSLKNRLANFKAKGEKAMMSAMGAGVAAATGMGLGLAAAYNKDNPDTTPEIQGAPVSAIGAVLMHGLAMMTDNEVVAEGARASGNACLGVAMFDFGRRQGDEWQKDEESGTDKGAGRSARRLARGVRSVIDGDISEAADRYDRARENTAIVAGY